MYLFVFVCLFVGLFVVYCKMCVCFEMSSGDVGRGCTMHIVGDGKGQSFYLDATNSKLKTAHCSDLLCSTATTFTLSPGLSVFFSAFFKHLLFHYVINFVVFSFFFACMFFYTFFFFFLLDL
jgi:hypothetical protein